MAGVRIFAVIVVALTVKNGVISCSLKSHKSGTSLCSSSTADSTTDDSVLHPYHHHPGKNLHKKPSLCDSSASSSSCLTSVVPSLPIGLPTKPFIPISNLPASASNLQTTPLVTSGYDLALLNSLIKFLTPSVGVNTPFSHLTFNKQPILPNSPSMNYVQVPVPISKPHNIFSKPNGATLPGSVSSSVPCVVNPSSIIPQAPVQQLPVLSPQSTFLQTDSFKTDLTNTMQKFPKIFSEPAGLIGSNKPTQMPPCSTFTLTSDKNTANTGLLGSKLASIPPFTLFTPTFNKYSAPLVSKPLSVTHHSHPCAPSLSSNFGLSNGSPGVPFDSSFLSKNTVLGEVSSSTLKTDLKIVPTSSTSAPVTEKASKLTSDGTSSQIPEEFPASTSLPSTLYGHNQAILNQILKMLQSPKPIALKSTPLTPYLPTVNTPFISKPNTSLISSQVQTPLSASPVCLTSNLSSCSPSNSVLPLKSTSVPVTPPSVPLLYPTFTSDISYGYNPAFMKLLVKQLLSNLASSPQTFPSSFPLPQSILKPTPVFSPISNPFPKPTNNDQLSDLNSDVMPNKFPDITPTPLQESITTPKIPLSNSNVNFTNNFYNTLFASSIPLITATTPLITPSTPLITPSTASLSSPCPQLSYNLNGSPESTTVPNKLNPCQLPSDSFPNLLSKFTNIAPGSSQTFSSLASVSAAPLPFSKSILEHLKNIIPEMVPQPTATPSPCLLPQLSSQIPCHLKHLRLHSLHGSHLPHSPHVSHSPHSPHLSHPFHSSHLSHSTHLPHSPLRCPLSSASALGTGCKHILL